MTRTVQLPATSCDQPRFDGPAPCGGEIDSTGYCSRCGVRAEAPAPVRAARPPAGRARSTASSSSPAYPSSSWMERRGTLRFSSDEDGDPRDALLADPALPERKRACRNPRCYEGRTEQGRPRLVEGFCRSCGWGYSFRPPLLPEMMVAERYRVLGAIGRGGLGWVYLAEDQRIGKFVVLKGLLTNDNPEHRRVTLDELRALANTDHPNIVAVHDTVRHRYELPQPGGEIDIDYIVMDYIPGRSLLQLYRDGRVRGHYMPILEAGASVLQALRALSYLHRLTPRGLLYNDFSPDNLMRNKAGRTWLIDLGGVSTIEEAEAGSWGKDGYRDPYDNPPSPQTDLYAVGRTLAMLTFHVPGFTDGRPLPGPETEPLLARHESFHQLLLRATHPRAEQRFGSADEMADQLEAVLRDVRAVEDGRPCAGLSNVFGPEVRVVGAGIEGPGKSIDRQACALALPDILVDPTDRYASQLVSLGAASPHQLLQALDSMPESSRETRLRAVRARLELLADRRGARPDVEDGESEPGRSASDDVAAIWSRGWQAHLAGQRAEAAAIHRQLDETLARCPVSVPGRSAAGGPVTIEAELAALAAEEPQDLRVPWLRGVSALVAGELTTARTEFDAVRSGLPGEAAPKLASGLCAELVGDPGSAVRHYAAVWRTDRSYVSAAFGLARCRFALDDPAGAVEVLGQVPRSSAYSTAAAMYALHAGQPRAGLDQELAPAYFVLAERLNDAHPDRIEIDDLRRQQAIVAALSAAKGWLERGRLWPANGPQPRPAQLFGLPFSERSMRFGLEAAYRRMAANGAVDLDQRIAYVDMANRNRNWSRW